MAISSLFKHLTLAGTLPFVACAIWPLFGVKSVVLLGSLDAVATSYGLLIVSFMAGTHWGQYLHPTNPAPINLFVTSNVIALFVWFAYLTGSSNGSVVPALVCQVVAFLALLAIDYRLRLAGLISQEYFRIRLIATLIVTLALLLVIAI